VATRRPNSLIFHNLDPLSVEVGLTVQVVADRSALQQFALFEEGITNANYGVRKGLGSGPGIHRHMNHIFGPFAGYGTNGLVHLT